MSAPFWSSPCGRIALHLGDCRDVMAGLADKSVDVVITDPPYSDHVHAHGRKGTRRTSSGWKGAPIAAARDLGFDALAEDVRRGCAGAFARIVRRWVVVFSDTESSHLWAAALADSALDYVRTAFWHKLGGAPQFTGDRPAVAVEAITLCHPPGRKRWNGGGKHGLYAVPIELHRGTPTDEERVHTTQKPVRLMRALVADFTDPDELILDPFAGSASTLVAAYEQGRRAIGVELDEENATAAAKRLEALVRQGSLFGAAP